MSDDPGVINASFVSERGKWQRSLIILFLAINAIIGLAGLNETNENESRSRDARPLLCGLAYDDALAEPSVAVVYRAAGCEAAFMPLPEG
jgi:hypothetical protein